MFTDAEVILSVRFLINDVAVCYLWHHYVNKVISSSIGIIFLDKGLK